MGSRRREKRRKERDLAALEPAAAPVSPPQPRPDSPRPLDPRLILFLGALALRLLHLWLNRGDFWLRTPLLDDNLFVSWADTIEREGWLARSLGVFHLNPAYPYLLALLGKTVGRGYGLVFALQHLFGALAAPLFFALAERAWDRRAAWAAGLLAALYGPAVFFESRFLGESWIYLANAVALACLVFACGAARPSLWWAGAGLALGVSTVFRPTALAFAPAALLWALGLLWFDRRLLAACAGAFLLGLWLPLLPFQLRNRALDPARGWGLTTSSGGVNLYLGNNPEADGLNQAPAFVRYGPGHEYQDFAEEAERRVGRSLRPAEVSRYWTGEALRWFRQRPRAAFGLLARKAAFFWNHKEPPDNFFLEVWRRFTRLGPIPLVSWGLVGPLGLAGLLWSLGRPELRGPWILHAYVLAYFAIGVGFYILARYRFPAAAGLIPFAGFALARLWLNLRERRWPRSAALGALMLGCFGLSRLNLIGDEDPAVSHYSMGVIYANQGWKDEAASEYRKSIAADPRFKASYINLGILSAQRGDAAAAAEALEGALRLEGDPARAAALRENIARLRAAR